MVDCYKWHEFKYCVVNGILVLGDNATAKSGLVSSGTYPSIVNIPFSVNGKEVKQIGAYSLEFCPLIKEIKIRAKITQINKHALWGCASLEKITIPNSCMYIFKSAIHVWNSSLGNEKTNPGTTEVIFLPNSKLAFIEMQGISYRENMYLYFCSYVNPKLDTYAFKWTINVVAFSPYSFTFNGTSTVIKNFPSLCHPFDYNTKNYSERKLLVPLSMIFICARSLLK